MAKRRKRSAFPTNVPTKTTPKRKESILADESVGGVFGFFRDIGVRETIESIIVAVVLAFMFRAYEAEAFIIPTGSMAPSLQGQHMDLNCEQCGVKYRAGASSENSISPRPDSVNSTYCPICQYRTKMRRNKNPDHNSNNGDRILVNKFIYDFVAPKRYDVIVFKNPNNGKQNYIKRLIGLPGDNILIENGDIYLMMPNDQGYERVITRKPPRKLRNVLQAVDDTNFIGEKLKSVEWPSRWQSFDAATSGNQWVVQESNGNPLFHAASTDKATWMRYRHFQPLKEEWPTIESGKRPSRFDGGLPVGRLIGDQYGYNDPLYTDNLDQNGEVQPNYVQNLGTHWVGDLGVECWVEVKSASGKLLLDLVEGGAHFTCSIDVATGIATLTCDDSKVETKVTFEDENGTPVKNPTAQTNLRGAGSYHIEYVNADDRINLWINNKLISFDAANYKRPGVTIPTYSVEDPGDAEPAGIGAVGLDVDVSRIKVLRDIYYSSRKGGQVFYSTLSNETGLDPIEIAQIQRDPQSWTGRSAMAYFTAKKGQTRPMFELKDFDDDAKDQFLPMGDNSPESLDGRVWSGEKYVERDMLIGRAMLIYWPHTLNSPTPFFPNFGEMGFIK
ncbi:MAG: signal peptidase I [Mariniblastus sp.]